MRIIREKSSRKEKIMNNMLEVVVLQIFPNGTLVFVSKVHFTIVLITDVPLEFYKRKLVFIQMSVKISV